MRNVRKKIVSSIFEKVDDLRPYAEIMIFGEKISGLMDTGASISCIGGDFAMKYLNSSQPYRKLNCKVHTADGKPQQIVGFIETRISFRGIEKLLGIYIIPSLAQPLYLGIDFWRLYDLLPLYSMNSATEPSISAILNSCDLDDNQKQLLRKTIERPFSIIFKRGFRQN